MTVPNTLDTFRQALSALFGPDPSAQKQANTWLTTFASTSEAWGAALTILEPGTPTEALFFCSNILLSKARIDWGKLPVDQRSQLTGAVSSKMNALIQAGTNSLVPQRLALVLACMAAQSGPEAAKAYVDQAFDMAAAATTQGPQLLQYALQFLTSIAEEGDQLDRGRRQALLPALLKQLQRTVLLVQQVVQGGEAAGGPAVVTAAIRCLHTWLKLDLSGGGSCCLAPGELQAAASPLLGALLEMLGAPLLHGPAHSSVSEAAGEVLAEVLGPGKTSEGDSAALQLAISALLQQRHRLSSGAAVAGPEALAAAARGVARVMAAISERDTKLVVSPSSEQALPVAELMLGCLGLPDRSVAEAALDYFTMLNTVPVAERHPQLCAPVYSSALPLLLQHGRYPDGFTTWEEAEEDADTFHRFRDQQLCDVLESAHAMMRSDFLKAVHSSLSQAHTWQQYEWGLYCLRAVNLRVKARVLGREGSGQAAVSPELAQEAADSGVLLSACFGDLCSGTGVSSRFISNPWVLQSACHLLGEYAAWFGRTDSAPLEGALRLLLGALQMPAAWRHAAHALRNMCVRCSSKLTDGSVLAGLMDIAQRAVAPIPPAGQVASTVGLEHDDRVAVYEGLARVVAGLPAAAAAEAGLHLINPLMQRAQSLAHAGSLSKEQLVILARDLKLLASSVRFLESPGQSEAEVHPALKVLEGAWPILAGVAQAPVCQQDGEVVEALCEVYQRALLATKVAGKPLLATLITSVMAIHKVRPDPCCCDVVGSAVEIFGELKSIPETGELQKQAITAMCATAFERLQAQGSQISLEGSELLRGVFSMADRYLVFARDVLLHSPVLQQLVVWAALTVSSVREREVVQQALALLTHLAGMPEKLAEAQEEILRIVDSCMAAEGQRVISSLLAGAADTCPRHVLRALSGCLYTLLTSTRFRDAACGWLAHALQQPQLTAPGAAPDALSAEDRQRFGAIATRQPPLPKGRFDALVADVASIARSEASSDVLMAYEL